MRALLPPIVPGESLRSYHDRAKLLNQATVGALNVGPDGARWNTPDWSLPTGLKKFAEHFGPALGLTDPTHWISGHTLAPYFEQTLSDSSRRVLASRLLMPQQGPRRPMLPIALSEWFTQSAVLCADCDEEALERSGFSFVQRGWLLPFATRCAQHNQPLATFPDWTPVHRGRPVTVPRKENRGEQGRRFSESSLALLDGTDSNVHGADLLARVGSLLQTRGFTSRGGRLRRTALAQALTRHAAGRYEHAELDHLLSSVERVEKLLAPLYARRGTLHPAVAVALVAALEDLPEVAQAAVPLARARVDVAALEDALKSATSATAAASEVGVSVQTAVTCAHAMGLRVSCRPKTVKGKLLERIVALLKDGVSPADVARTCKVSLSTVYRRRVSAAALTQVAHERKSQQGQSELGLRQERWERLVIEHPQATVSALRALAPADYAFLYRNARGWLQASYARLAIRSAEAAPVPNSPGPGDARKPRRGRAPEGADFALAQRISRTADQDALNLPRRHTTTGLLAKAGRVRADWPTTPASAAVLRKHAESKETFIRRRLRAAALRLLNRGEPLAAWRIVREARLRPTLVEALGFDVHVFADQAREQTLAGL